MESFVLAEDFVLPEEEQRHLGSSFLGTWLSELAACTASCKPPILPQHRTGHRQGLYLLACTHLCPPTGTCPSRLCCCVESHTRVHTRSPCSSTRARLRCQTARLRLPAQGHGVAFILLLLPLPAAASEAAKSTTGKADPSPQLGEQPVLPGWFPHVSRVVPVGTGL